MLIAIAIDTILTPLSLIAGHAGFPFAWHFFKIPFLMVFAIAFLYSASKGLKLTVFSLFFLIIGIIAIFIGLSRGQINSAFLSHSYHLVLGLTCFSLGRALNLEIFKDYILRSFNFLVIYSLMFSLIYYQLYTLGIIGYWGISSNFGYIAVMLLASNKIRQALLTIISIVLTGKRTVLLGSVLTIIAISFFRKQKFTNLFLLVMSFVIVGFVAFYAGLLSRFTSAFDIEDATRFWYVLTSGRNFEIGYALAEFKTTLDWIIGFGYGMSFEIPIGPDQLDKLYTLHYTHFSPTSLLLLYGGVSTLILYLFFFNSLFKAIKFSRGQYGIFCGLYIYSLITSFAGAIIFVDGKFWILLGIISQINYMHNNKVPKNVY